MSRIFSRPVIGIFLFLATLILGLITYKDYGVSWDDPAQREIGEVNYNYIFHNDPRLLTYGDRDYGVAFEMVLLLGEKGLHLTDTRDIYLFRHLAIHILFLLSALAAYFLMYDLFKSRWLAALGFLILVFHPRIYAHSFFNSKDIPFLSMFLISLVVANAAFKRNKPLWFVLLGLICGYTTGIRIMGIMLITIIAGFIIVDIIAGIRTRKAAASIVNLLCFLAAAVLTLYIVWPVLWANPVTNFINALSIFSHYVWNSPVLFCGTSYEASALPWYYIPVWFAISTPVLWLIASVVGIGILCVRFIKQPAAYITNTPRRNYLLYLLCFAGPVAAVILFHSVVYDDWRHLYFIYPPFVMLVLYAFDNAMKSRWGRVISVFAAIQLAGIAWFMIRYHPVQQVYFNSLAGDKKTLGSRFEMEYWGCSYKQGFEYLLKNNKTGSIRVSWTLHPVINNYRILDTQQRQRIILDDETIPYYIITNYRGRSPDKFPYTLVYKLQVLDNTVLGVYRVDKPGK